MWSIIVLLWLVTPPKSHPSLRLQIVFFLRCTILKRHGEKVSVKWTVFSPSSMCKAEFHLGEAGGIPPPPPLWKCLDETLYIRACRSVFIIMTPLMWEIGRLISFDVVKSAHSTYFQFIFVHVTHWFWCGVWGGAENSGQSCGYKLFPDHTLPIFCRLTTLVVRRSLFSAICVTSGHSYHWLRVYSIHKDNYFQRKLWTVFWRYVCWCRGFSVAPVESV